MAALTAVSFKLYVQESLKIMGVLLCECRSVYYSQYDVNTNFRREHKCLVHGYIMDSQRNRYKFWQ